MDRRLSSINPFIFQKWHFSGQLTLYLPPWLRVAKGDTKSVTCAQLQILVSDGAENNFLFSSLCLQSPGTESCLKRGSRKESLDGDSKGDHFPHDTFLRLCLSWWDSQCQSNCHPRDYQRSFFLSALPSHFRESEKTKHHQFSFYTRMQYTKPKDCCHVMGMSLLKVGKNIISTISLRMTPLHTLFNL